MIEIQEVTTKSDLKDFIYLPKQIHKNHSNWHYPIYADEWIFFDPKKNIQIRVTGKAVILDDLELKKEITEARPFLKPWVERMGYDMLIVFQVIDCIAHTWTFETNLSPKEFIKIN